MVSALATVGVTANVTSTLNGAGLALLWSSCLSGRIGPLTHMVSLNNYPAKKARYLAVCQGRHHYRIGETHGESDHWNFKLGILDKCPENLTGSGCGYYCIIDVADVINQYESMITTGIVRNVQKWTSWITADIGTCDSRDRDR